MGSRYGDWCGAISKRGRPGGDKAAPVTGCAAMMSRVAQPAAAAQRNIAGAAARDSLHRQKLVTLGACADADAV